jgi:hypothetical protein
MNVVVYFRSRPSEPDASTAALARQVAAVDVWLTERGAKVAETFTEAETGSPSRPALGAALKACRRHGADLLIATTDAIGTGARFDRVTDRIGDVRCHALTQPEAVPTDPEPLRVVVYYRTRPEEAEASAAALAVQEAGVAAWMERRPSVRVGSFTEAEQALPGRIAIDRPVLAEALRHCRTHGATLLVGTSAPIGSGPMPTINVLSVPVLYAGFEIPPPDVMPLPERAPEGFSLYLHRTGTTRLPMYLCNRTDRAITDVELAGNGVTTKLQDEVTMSATSRRLDRLDRLEPGCCGLIDEYDLMSDGDGLLAFVASYTDAEGARRRLSGLLGTDVGAGSLIRLDA